jgi:hypothetical protein
MNATTPMGGRGPDPRALALQRNADAILAALAEEERLRRILDELRDAQAWAAELGLSPAAPTFGRVMEAAAQVHRGVAFWDREVPEPTPLEVAR